MLAAKQRGSAYQMVTLKAVAMSAGGSQVGEIAQVDPVPASGCRTGRTWHDVVDLEFPALYVAVLTPIARSCKNSPPNAGGNRQRLRRGVPVVGR
jgi:hypothetical protein